MPKDCEAWRNECINIIRQAMPDHKPMEGLLQCRLDLFPPNAACDFDNYNKPIFDALEHAKVYSNDRQVRACLIVIRNIYPGGLVRLSLEQLGA